MKELRYSGKPLAYLDHNILDLFSKYKEKPLLSRESDFFKYLKDDVQAVYSPTTLEEIIRSVVNGKSSKYGVEFLDILRELNAHYINLIKDEKGSLTNTIFRSWEDLLIHFNQYIESNYLNKFIKPLKNNLFGLYGGVKDYDRFKNEQIENLNNLLLFLERSLNFLENSESKDDYILSEIEKYKVELTNVINQIWEMLQNNNAELKSVELEDFFHLRKSILKNEYYIFEKVNQIYTMLNLFGYHQDEGMHKQKRFIASFSDMSHASYGCFCDYLFTRDKAFSLKVDAAYEYLNVATKIYLVK